LYFLFESLLVGHLFVGGIVGAEVTGFTNTVGADDGPVVGDVVSLFDGLAEGDALGILLGLELGSELGAALGDTLGSVLGLLLGELSVGAEVLGTKGR